MLNRPFDISSAPLEPLIVEVAETNAQTIEMYERWGFRQAPELGVRVRHWPEWPEGLTNDYIFLLLEAEKSAKGG